MKFTCQRGMLLQALGVLNSVIPSHSVRPVLQNIRFEVFDETSLKLSATDLDIGMTYILPVENVSDASAFVLPASRLSGIIREAWGDTIEFTIKDSKADIRTERGRFQIIGEEGADFPTIAEMEIEKSIELRAEDLMSAVQRVLFATARNEAMYSLAGVFVCIEGDAIEVVATDTHRVALSKKKLHGTSAETMKAIVLAKGMQELCKLLHDEEMVRIQITGTMFMAKTSRATLVSHLIEGQFPRYREVIPAAMPKSVTAKRDEFVQALRQAALLTNEITRAVKLTAEEGILTIQSTAPEMGEAKIELDATVVGGPVTASFNCSYIADVLKVLGDDQVTLQLKDANSPGMISTDDYTYVVSPIYPKN